MMWIEMYPWVKLVHVSLVGCNGLLFAARGVAVLAGRAWPMQSRCRKLSYAIDTLLLVAGLTLWLILRLNPMRDSWFGVKLLLLVLYIVAGSLALKRSRTRSVQCMSFGCALALYVLIASVAITHRPLGLLNLLSSEVIGAGRKSHRRNMWTHRCGKVACGAGGRPMVQWCRLPAQ